MVYVKFEVRFFLSQAHALIACLDGSSPNIGNQWSRVLVFVVVILSFFTIFL